MRKFLALAAALFCAVASAATTTPIQLLSPAGSTSGQAIVSNGPSSAPTWQAVPMTGVTGVLPIANGGTNASTASAALSNLGGAALAGAAFTGDVTLVKSGAANSILRVSGLAGNYRGAIFQTAGLNRWGLFSDITSEGGADAGSIFILRSYTDAGADKTDVLSFSRATGVGAFAARPTFAGNTPWDSGNLNFASPPAIGGTTPAAGAFTTLSSTGAFTPSQTAGIVGTTTNNNANAGSIGEYICAQVTNGGSPTGCATNTNTPVSLTTGVTANVTSISLTAGDWHVCGNVGFVAGGTTNVTAFSAAIHTISAAFPTPTGFGAYVSMPISFQTGQGPVAPVGCTRMSLASTTTVYLVTNSNFNTSTNAAIGFIAARRAR